MLFSTSERFFKTRSIVICKIKLVVPLGKTSLYHSTGRSKTTFPKTPRNIPKIEINSHSYSGLFKYRLKLCYTQSDLQNTIIHDSIQM